MITTLQREMDALKTSSEAARAAAGSGLSYHPLIIDAEKASREAIQRKCEKLEGVIEVQPPIVDPILITQQVLRVENTNMNGLLTRKERIMKQDAEMRKQLQGQFEGLQAEKSALQSEIAKIQKRLSSVEESLAQETLLRQKSDVEYAALRSQVNQASERSRQDLAALRTNIQTLKNSRKEDARTMQIMAAELDRLSNDYQKEKDTAREAIEDLKRLKDKQRDAFERAIKALRKELENQMQGNQENVLRTGEALSELKALNSKIRAVNPDYR
jgi:chromosome segregation ATPase